MPKPTIINPGQRYRPASLIEPSPSGYLHLAAEIDPPGLPGPARSSRRRSEALAALGQHRAALAGQHRGCTVEFFRVAGLPPLGSLAIPERYRDAIGRYDVIVLIKTATVGDLDAILADPAYHGLLDSLRQRARKVTVTQAGNVRRIADVPAGNRLHLFNHFLAADAAAALEVWDYLAGWYQQEMDLTNSEVLAPAEPDSTPFAFINHASWNSSLPKFMYRQMSRSTFRSFVFANLRANDISSLPFLYRPHRGEGS